MLAGSPYPYPLPYPYPYPLDAASYLSRLRSHHRSCGHAHAPLERWDRSSTRALHCTHIPYPHPHTYT